METIQTINAGLDDEKNEFATPLDEHINIDMLLKGNYSQEEPFKTSPEREREERPWKPPKKVVTLNPINIPALPHTSSYL